MNKQHHFTLTFFFSDENLSALFTNSIVFPLRADQSWMANIKDGSGGWWNTGTHMMGRCGVWTAWGLASCKLTEQMRECFFIFFYRIRIEVLGKKSSRWEIQHRDFKEKNGHAISTLDKEQPTFEVLEIPPTCPACSPSLLHRQSEEAQEGHF